MFVMENDMILRVFKTNFPASQAKGSELCVFMKDFKEDPLVLFSFWTVSNKTAYRAVLKNFENSMSTLVNVPNCRFDVKSCLRHSLSQIPKKNILFFS